MTIKDEVNLYNMSGGDEEEKEYCKAIITM